MLLEFRRFVRSPFALVSFFMGAGCFLFTYVTMLAFNQSQTIEQVLLSSYTVCTQHGMFWFSAVAVAFVAKDYNEKTLIFCKSLGFDALRYHMLRAALSSMSIALGCAVFLTVTCAVFGDFSAWLVMMVHYASVIVAYCSFSVLLSWLLGSFIKAYFATTIYFFAAVVLAFEIPSLRFLQAFDMNGFIYKDLQTSLSDFSTFNAVEAQRLVVCVLCALVVFAGTCVLSLVLKKRWVTNGI